MTAVTVIANATVNVGLRSEDWIGNITSVMCVLRQAPSWVTPPLFVKYFDSDPVSEHYEIKGSPAAFFNYLTLLI